MGKYSIAMIKGSYEQKKDWERQFPTNYYIFRPLSFYLTYFLIRFTESPSRLAWVGFFIGLGGCLSLLLSSYITIWPGVLFLAVFALLDAVDGNVARVTGQVTYYGKFLDAALGEVIEGSYCLWLGLGLYSISGDLPVILAGTAVMFGRLFGGMFQLMYYFNFIQKQQGEGSLQGDITEKIASSAYRGKWWYLLFINLHTFTLQLLLLALCAAFKLLDLFLFFFALYYLSRALTIMFFYSCSARKNLV